MSNHRGGGGGGTPHPAARAHGAQRGHEGGPPITLAQDTPARPGRAQDREAKEGALQTQQCAQTARRQEEAGYILHAPTARGLDQESEGDPPKWKRALPAHGMPERGEGDSPIQEEEEGEPPSSVRSQHTACRGGVGEGKP